jgi:hypothetical protein
VYLHVSDGVEADEDVGCNVGYAFVNFIDVQDLLKFARAKLAVAWNVHASSKSLEMCYANYQYGTFS